MTFYAVEEFEDPLYTLLVTLGLTEISHEDYEVLESCDNATLCEYVTAATADPTTTWSGFIMLLQELEGRSPPPPPPPEDSPQVSRESRDGRGDSVQQDKIGDSWICTRCCYTNKPDAEICRTCSASYWCEDEPLNGTEMTDDSSARVHQVLLRSDSLPVPGCAFASFAVKKSHAGNMFGKRVKERIIRMDFCGQRFLNYEPKNPNRHSVSLESINLYRVEKHFNVAQGRPANASSLVSNSNAPPTVRVYFFKTNHPIDLEFPSAVECRRFLEQAALHRKHAVVWAPSLCRHSRREALLRVFDESAFKKSGAASPNELPGFTASRVSHEVIRFWAGCLDMAEQHALAPSVELREALRAGEADIFVIGVINISPGQMKLELGKQLSSLFESMCGSDFYLVLNSASEVNAFANVPDCRSKSGGANDACLLLARRSLLSKFCHFSCRSVSDPLQPMNRGIYVSFHMQESSFGFLVANLGGVVEDIMDTEEKNTILRNLLGQAGGTNSSSEGADRRTGAESLGDPNLEISSRFDYFFILGKLGYSLAFVRGAWVDELAEEMQRQTFLHGFSQDLDTACRGCPVRVLIYKRPSVTNLQLVRCGTLSEISRGKSAGGEATHEGDAFADSSVALLADAFCLRTYCYAWSVQLPSERWPTITFHHIRVVIEALSNPNSKASTSAAAGISSAQCITSSSVLLICPALEASPICLTTKQYDEHRKTVIHCEVGSALSVVCPAHEWLMVQSVAFTVRGVVPQMTFKAGDAVASGVMPLRLAMAGGALGRPVPISVALVRETVPIGVVECEITVSFP